MNTDKLMEMERKWRGMNCRTEAQDRVYRVCADELAAALRAEQAVGEEQRAREMLAEEVRYAVMGEYLRNPAVKLDSFSADVQAAVRAIRRALGAARQPEPTNPVPAPWIEEGGLMARICETKYGVGISYNCEEAITAFRDFFARQSEVKRQDCEDCFGAGVVHMRDCPTCGGSGYCKNPASVSAEDKLTAVLAFLRSDATAISYQSLGQYRKAAMLAAAPGGEGEG